MGIDSGQAHGNSAGAPAHAGSAIAQPRLDGTADVVFKEALAHHQAGEFALAQSMYRQVLHHAPGHAAATHFLGVLLHQCGQHGEGLDLVQASIAAQPRIGEWHNTLGNMLAALGRQDDAVHAFLAALEIHPRNAIAWNNLGALLLAQGRTDGAMAALHNALAIDPTFRDALCHLGDAQAQAGDAHAAALSYCTEYVLRPAADTERHVLGIAYSKLGRYGEAAAVYTEWLREEPGHPIAQHLLAACQGHAQAGGASHAYLQSYFDDFADSFEHKLVGSLAYRVPVAMEHALRELAPALRSLRMLDAGCGTGLCGVALRPWARHLTGVDLSAKALDKARAKTVYDALHHGEIVQYLSSCPAASFDLVAAADTLIYFGSIDSFLAQARRTLAPGGWLVASFEEWQPADGEPPGSVGYRINATGRYSHTEHCVRHGLNAARFDPMRLLRLDIRNELGQPVPGMLVVARASAG